MDLSRLLKENVAAVENATYIPSERFTDEKGKPQVWTLKPLSSGEVDALLNKHTKRKAVVEFDKNGKRKTRQEVDLDEMAVIDDMILESLVDPSKELFENGKLQDSWGVFGAVSCLKAMFTAGEYTDLRAFVQGLSGYDSDFADDVAEEAIKN